ncbi:MAG: gliding motility-associated ABC transporter ATP-binding subunit GldA, partial [Thermoflexibacter sp.]|nr:gliding motility-associated ABC transporter ATP-binding subunit GldA [Thermoflexibacter sp.]
IIEIRNVIKEVSKEKTVLFSTHILQEVNALCDRVVIINLGNIVKDSPLSQLQTQGSEVKIQIELEGDISIEPFRNITEIIDIQRITDKKILLRASRDVRSEISKIALDKGWLILGMSKEETSLESIFQEATSKG